jgi:glycosyltransferase involved in cell wall biosynthesis
LKDLINQTADKSHYEIIVVDNNSADDTKKIVEANIILNSQVNIRYILETNQGLSHARNRGWIEAKGNYVAYIDDDCKAPEQWMEMAMKIIPTHSPAIFGGPYYAYYNSSKPKWFKDSYGSMSLGDKAHSLGKYEFLSGGNIFFRKSLLKEIGGFDPKLGMVGNKIAYGEETAIQIYVRKSMPSELLYYDPDLYVHHLVRENKMTLRWQLKHSFTTGQYCYKISNLKKDTNYRMEKKGIRVIVSIIYAAIITPLRDKEKYPYVQNYVCEYIFEYFFKLGRLYEQFKWTNN